MRLALTDRKAPRAWRTLNLENEHLRITVLPDLGGRLWRAVDKANGAQMFYANPSLKFAQVAYRGAWATFGIEFNFPVSHNWVTSSPVDYALVRDRDGSASIVVGNIDLVYGMQWRVALTLRPGRSVLEQATTLYNRSETRHRFYWWTNAAVETWDDSQLVYPMEFTATHGFTQVDTWPVDTSGVDLSRPFEGRRLPDRDYAWGGYSDSFYIRNKRWALWAYNKPTGFKLFDLQNDPGQNDNVASRYPGVVNDLYGKVLARAGGRLPWYGGI